MARKNTDNKALSRRGFLSQSLGAGVTGVAGAAALGAAPVLSAAPVPATAATGSTKGIPQFRPDGTYETVPLRSDSISLGIMQTRVLPVDGKDPKPGLRANLEHMVFAIDAVQNYGNRKDMLAFHEFPLTGWAKWTRKEVLRFALTIPGPETEVLAAKAKEYNCYLSFGTYAQEPDWPGHVISMSVIIGPKGDIVSKQWKHRNIHSSFAEFELFTSSTYDVLDRYVEMYGWDAVIPVARTDIGNICISPCQWEPELYRAMAVKGGEILIRTSSGGSTPDMRVMCRVNRVYGGLSNNSISPGNRYFLESAGGGGTEIYGPSGEVLAKCETAAEDCAVARIPIAAFRKTHRVPDVYKAIYTHVLDRPEVRFEPNAFLEHLPETLEESAAYFRKKAKW